MASFGREKLAQTLFRRYDGNPILTVENWPYPINSVFNPAATRFKGGIMLLNRVEDLRGFSHLTTAFSRDGLSNWEIDDFPTMMPESTTEEQTFGLEDPRIVWLEEQQQYAIVYTSFSEGGAVVSLAITKNFKTFARLGGMVPPEDKDACLFPRRFNGRFALIHRPIVRGEAHIWMSLSPDLKHWGDHRVLLHTRHGYWDGARIGLGCQPIEIPEGWLIFYHGVRRTTANQIYRMGIALLDKEMPWKVLRRSEEWVLGPREMYERIGDVGDVTFVSGAVVHEETNELFLYYGAADDKVAVAIADMDRLREYVMKCPEVYE
ncbi:Beta-1,4-mannooligosaccharide phosphorylase [Anaerohalosphaera lusitana]|uniref:Beta-1,4-mannooligosaccharide phosphorylase n=1 Tax=Anaerohalosphaera lusitana TaxID=1936003 RepID=A0A1U9NHL5_9BACT|nr:glycosidase [Anaerohalosphaera lusitana]AQT67267.1 Beta-1,4-mannooligosaccharide phosphorylase [Anaerohalosphaera lusitana]